MYRPLSERSVNRIGCECERQIRYQAKGNDTGTAANVGKAFVKGPKKL
jgi:hypothetical protein